MNTVPGTIIESIRAAGVVGAGGAGFPTHVKAQAKAEIVISNGAECEPLLHKDKELMKRHAPLLVEGLQAMMAATGAKKGVLAVKEKYHDVAAACEEAVAGKPGLKVHRLGDFYPAGDEFTLVYEVTGRLIPPAGIPIQIGAVVDNVETLINVALAGKQPVTDTYLTVTGAVHKPVTLKLPVGTSVAEAVGFAGGAKASPFGVLESAMMGRVMEPSEPITKTTGGLIVLPADHGLMRKKTASAQRIARIGKSACDQCSFCTEFCPRYLLGYAIEPHKVMRSLGFAGSGSKVLNEWALLCCECSLCSLYACPEELDPKNVCVGAKASLREAGTDWKKSSLAGGRTPTAHPMMPYRKVPISRLTRKLGLWDYRADAPLDESIRPIKRVRIPLKQHLGVPAEPAVSAGQKVRRGELVGRIPEGKLGAAVHASIDGTVTSVDSCVTIEAS